MGTEREIWSGKLGFLLASVAYTIGFGNLWRFPYNCLKHGGGAFLIPYVLTYVLVGVPMLFLEYSLGQFTSQSVLTSWRMSKLFVGLGWASLLNTSIVFIYYNVLLMYALYYMVVAFVNIGGTLPWHQCGNEWNTELCYSTIQNTQTEISGYISHCATLKSEACIAAIQSGLPLTADDMNCSSYNQVFSSCAATPQSSFEQYWTRFVLGVHEVEGTGSVGSVVARNAVLLLVTWLIIFFCARRGIRSMGNVVYVSATFPFFMLIILLVRGLTLSGSSEGINYFIIPDWDKLGDLKVWSAAASQALFSLGPAYGCHITLASHNKFHSKIFRDTLIVTIGNATTSILGGFVIFSLLGHRAFQSNISIDSIPDTGPGLMFVTYSDGISQLPGSPAWACLFFLMLIFLGIDSQFVMVWTLVDSLQDLFHEQLKKKMTRKLVLLTVCLLGFLLGLPHTTEGGITLVVMLDSYTSSFNILVIMVLQATAVGWVYDEFRELPEHPSYMPAFLPSRLSGAREFICDVEMMIGPRSLWFWSYWLLTWLVTTPIFCAFLLIASAIGYSTPTYEGKPLPSWAEGLGWTIVVLPLVTIATGAAYQIYIHKSLVGASGPDERWGPRLADNRTGKYLSDSYIHAIDVTVAPPPEPCSNPSLETELF